MRRALALVVLLVVAGCSVPITDPSSGDSATPSPTPEWTGDADNPYREATLTVAFSDETGSDRAYEPFIQEAITYWEQNADEYAGYPIEYEFAPNATDPDVRVRFVETIDSCGSEQNDLTAGCAPYVTEGPVQRPVNIRIEAGYSNDSTVQVLKHEFGHTLGLAHGDAPTDIMSAQTELATLPQPNATDRVMPWASPNLTYAVTYDGVPADERDTTRQQTEAALDYIANGADGTIPENVSFTRVDDPQAANVTIKFVTDGGDSQSLGNLRGFDPDRDGALETYSSLSITVSNIHPDARGWHVGYWTARGFGLRGEELPEPLRSESASVRRSEWWR